MKNYIINAIVALLLIIGVGIAANKPAAMPEQSSQNTFGSVRVIADEYPNGIRTGNLSTLHNEIGGIIPLGVSQQSWKNNLGKIVYFDFADAATLATSSSLTGAVATSSYRIIIGTSTASTVDNFLTPNSFNASLLLWPLATSTISNSLTGSTTNSIQVGQLRGVGVLPNGYLNVSIINGATGAPVGTCAALVACESATSTNRGFRLKWSARYHD